MKTSNIGRGDERVFSDWCFPDIFQLHVPGSGKHLQKRTSTFSCHISGRNLWCTWRLGVDRRSMGAVKGMRAYTFIIIVRSVIVCGQGKRPDWEKEEVFEGANQSIVRAESPLDIEVIL